MEDDLKSKLTKIKRWMGEMYEKKREVEISGSL